MQRYIGRTRRFGARGSIGQTTLACSQKVYTAERGAVNVRENEHKETSHVFLAAFTRTNGGSTRRKISALRRCCCKVEFEYLDYLNLDHIWCEWFTWFSDDYYLSDFLTMYWILRVCIQIGRSSTCDQFRKARSGMFLHEPIRAKIQMLGLATQEKRLSEAFERITTHYYFRPERTNAHVFTRAGPRSISNAWVSSR
jgi:hypothetical protein